ncbi:MAG: PEP-CTERM sorting domain-containing protein [Deltaproteobacteria bacterium]|nr:PEP-CTERM sorting domain-containing protein [Deltaproteobacteria bacterium]
MRTQIGSWIIVAAALFGPSAAEAGLITGQPARDLFEAAVVGAGYAKITFNNYAVNTKLTTQISGLTFKTIRDYNGSPINQPVNLASAVNRTGQIVGTPCSACTDDGRYAYEVSFGTAQRAAGIQRYWNASTVTRFFNANGVKLGEYVGSTYVGWFGVEGDASTYVKRIEIDGNVFGGARQVGYSDDLIYGLGVIPEPATASLVALGLAGLAARTRQQERAPRRA